ncbi:MAG: hypothetical protein AVDCRST_MAG18-4624, partial [uncultured Thermomicrobiales bacterium]
TASCSRQWPSYSRPRTTSSHATTGNRGISCQSLAPKRRSLC